MTLKAQGGKKVRSKNENKGKGLWKKSQINTHQTMVLELHTEEHQVICVPQLAAKAL